MPKYNVEVQMTINEIVQVEASTKDEAKQLATDTYMFDPKNNNTTLVDAVDSILVKEYNNLVFCIGRRKLDNDESTETIYDSFSLIDVLTYWDDNKLCTDTYFIDIWCDDIYGDTVPIAEIKRNDLDEQ